MSGMLCAHVAVLAVLTPSSGSSVSRVLSGLRRPVDVHDGVHHDHGVTISLFVSMVVIRQNLRRFGNGLGLHDAIAVRMSRERTHG
jgi:hypothetical protein